MAAEPVLSNSQEPTGFRTVPDVSERTLEDARLAVENKDQAFQVCERLMDDAKGLIVNAASITKKLAGSPPYSDTKLKEQGKSWTSNFSSRFLATVVKRVAPRLMSRIKNARYLTADRIPDELPDGTPVQNAAEKTEIFRDEFSKTLRRWRRFHFMLSRLVNEDSAFGFTFPAWLDQEDWRPTIFRQDTAFVPTGTEILEEDLPFFMVKDSYKPHELIEKVEDKESAEAAGWDIEEVVKSVNAAVPKDMAVLSQDGMERMYEEAIRQVIPATSYMKGSRQIDVYHLFATETDGSVTHWILDVERKTKLFMAEEWEDSMRHVTVPVVFEDADGSVQGSQGVGQSIYELAVEVEKVRNAVVDNARDRGRVIIHYADDGERKKAKFAIADKVIAITGGTPSSNTAAIPSIVEDALSLDEFLMRVAEQAVGAFLPDRPIPGTSPTATQVQINQLKEEETRESTTDTLLTQWLFISAEIKRRLLLKGTDDDVAKQFQKTLKMRGLLDNEIDYLRNLEPEQTVVNFTEQRNAAIAAWAQSRLGDADFNQKRLKKLIGVATVGAEITDETLIPEEDQTIVLEAQRLQTIELLALMQGINVPVSPRDNDLIHMDVLRGTGDQPGPMGTVVQGGNVQAATALLNHYQAHVTNANEKELLGERMNEEKKFISDYGQQIEKIAGQPPAGERQTGAQAVSARTGRNEAQVTIPFANA